MELRDLRTLFGQGALKSAAVCRHPMGDGWELHCTTQTGETVQMHLANKRGVRVFRTIDAAAQSATEIGFKRVVVAL